MNKRCTVLVYKKTGKLSADFKDSEVRRAIAEIKSDDIFKMSKDDYIKERNDLERENAAACHWQFHEYTRAQYDLEMKKHLDDIANLEKFGFDAVLDLYPGRVYLDNGKNEDLVDRTEFYLIAKDEPFAVIDEPVERTLTGHCFHADSAEDLILYLRWQGKVEFKRLGYAGADGNFVEGFTDDLVARIRKFFTDNGENDLYVKIEW